MSDQAHARRTIVATIAALTLVLTAFVQSVAAAPKPDPRIIGGEPADFGEYPFMVALLFEPTVGNDFQKQYCGGSLIASRWVLTAAHCLDFLESPDEVAVAVSRTNLDSTEGQRVAVRDFFVHPDWDPNVISPDVGLIQLARPVTGVEPIQLAGAEATRSRRRARCSPSSAGATPRRPGRRASRTSSARSSCRWSPTPRATRRITAS